MTEKWMIGRGWSVQLTMGLWLLIGQSAIAALMAVEPALAESPTPLPKGDLVVESTSAAALIAEPEAEPEQVNLEAELNAIIAATADLQPIPATVTVPYSEVTLVIDLPDTMASSAETALGPVIAQAQTVAITDIQIEATAAGFTLRLEASSELAEPETSVTGNAAIANIPNAVLQLPDGDDFFVSDPAEGISLINVTTLPDNQVQIAITGTDAPPAIDISIGAAGLTVSGTPGDPSVQLPDEETIQITVTGQEDNDYFVPNASTATRTNTRLLDTPQSIQVIPQQVLEDQQILRVDEALRNVSGVEGLLEPFSSGASLTLRGFTTSSFTNGAILRDGFRIFNNLSSQATTNIERIEVIKGPSSVLYGRTDPGGLINLVTKRPLSEPFYDLGVQIGSFGLIRPSIDLTGPLTEDSRLTYRLNASVQRENSFRGFDADTDRSFIAPVLSWDIGDRTNLTLLLEYLDEEIPFDSGLPVIGTSVVDVPRDRIQNEPSNRLRNSSLTLGYDLEHQFNDSWVLNHGFRYIAQNHNVEIVLVGGFDEATGNVTRFFADRIYRTDDYAFQTSVVGEFNTGSIQHTLLAGFDLEFNRFYEPFTRVDFSTPSVLNIFNPVYANSRPDLSNLTPLVSGNTLNDRYGIFVQDQIAFSEQLILVGSLRYDTVSFRDLRITPSIERNDEAWSPRVGFVYQPIETVALYANYSQSFRPNSGTSFTGDAFEPEQGEGFEVGVKAELLDGSLLATLAYFDITKQNVLTTDPDNPFFSIAVGEQRSQGVELDIAGEILPGWNIIANYAYTDAHITKDNRNPVGNRLANSPRHSAGLWTTYEIQTGDLQGLGFGLGFDYVGKREGDLANSFEVDNYLLTNAALFYERDDWRFGLNFNNLFNVNYIRATSTRTQGNVPGAPFSVVGSVSVQF